MELTIDLENLKTFTTSSTAEQEAQVEKDYEDWVQSDFAGFRNILDACSPEHPNLDEIQAAYNKHQAGATGAAIKNFVLCGTGGSSLGAETIIQALYPVNGPVKFYFCDNNDPTDFLALLSALTPEETLFYIVSKSGGTPETWSQFLTAIEWCQKTVGDHNWKQHFVLCTDPNKGDLRTFAQSQELTCLDVPPTVGGRFSVLTAVGLFPTCYAQIEAKSLLEGALELVEAWETLPKQENPIYQIAHAYWSNQNRPISILFSYSSYLKSFGRWFSQLWAESLGKDGKGFTPYPAIGTTDQHSQTQLYMDGPSDKVICFIQVDNTADSPMLKIPEACLDLASVKLLQGKSMGDLFNAEFRATRDAFTQNKIPNFTINLHSVSPKSIGALFYFWEWVTVYTGSLLSVNPFDQPGVEKSKILTKEYLQQNS